MDSLLRFFGLPETDGILIYWLKESLTALLVFASFWLGAILLRHVLTTWGTRFTSFTATDLDDRILRRVTPPLGLLVVCAGAYYAIRSLPLTDKVQLVSSGLVFVLNVIIIANLAYRITDEFMQWYAAHLAGQDNAGLNRQLIPLLEKLVSIFLIGTALIIVLKHFNYDVLSVVTALGIGSLAIGLAAKDTLANMISGFTLMIDRPFRIGDRIQLAGGQWGDVIDIGLRSTKIRTVDNTLLIMPNSELCNSLLINMAFPDMRARGRINIGVDYGSDVERVKSLLLEVALSVPEVLREPSPESFFVSFGESALNMSLFFWVHDHTMLFAVTDTINMQVIMRFRQEGIIIPFPKRTVLLEKEG